MSLSCRFIKHNNKQTFAQSAHNIPGPNTGSLSFPVSEGLRYKGQKNVKINHSGAKKIKLQRVKEMNVFILIDEDYQYQDTHSVFVTVRFRWAFIL